MRVPKKIWDLTQPIYHNCPGWPGHRLTVIDWEFQQVNYGFNAERVSFNTHVATHVDVPYHFLADGKTLERMPAETFAGSALFLDLRKTVKPDTAIGPEEIKSRLAEVEKGDIVVLVTGYGWRYGFSDEYLHAYPYLGGPAAELIAASGAKGVATDALSLGGWGSAEKGRSCHMAVLSKGLFILEGLMVPDELLDGKKRYLTCFPMLLQGCGGAPARAVVYDFD
ncbi:MAG: cyclase family protein [Planctomycetota bacterium]|jgi:kynurenine formamidase|nr:cyclase family protein [Planctomycetota bacterium]